MTSIFENVRFLNESNNDRYILEDGEYIKNCNVFITESMISACKGNRNLLRETVLNEGKKFDDIAKKIFKDEKDYKGLSSELKEIIKANDLDDKYLKSNTSKFMKNCKKAIKICEELTPTVKSKAIGGVIGGAMTGSAFSIIGSIVGFVVGFIINKVFRLAAYAAEFDVTKKDALYVLEQLDNCAETCYDPKLKKRYEKEADRLRKCIEKYDNREKVK